MSFQSHTASHRALTGLSDEEMKEEFERSNARLEELTGRPVRALCYPTGAVNDDVVEVVKDYYDFAYTTVNRTSTEGFSVYELPRIRVFRGIQKTGFSYLIP